MSRQGSLCPTSALSAVWSTVSAGIAFKAGFSVDRDVPVHFGQDEWCGCGGIAHGQYLSLSHVSWRVKGVFSGTPCIHFPL